MEKNMTLTYGINCNKSISDIMKKVINKVNTPVQLLSRYYSNILEKEVTSRQTWLLIEAQTAFFAGIMPADYPIVARLLFGAWFIIALHKCRKSGL